MGATLFDNGCWCRSWEVDHHIDDNFVVCKTNARARLALTQPEGVGGVGGVGGQASEGVRGMPGHTEARKAVVSCDKPGGGAHIQ